MLNELITSKTRYKLLLKFFLNQDSTSYLRNLERELNESANSIRTELTKLENLQLLISSMEGNKKVYQVNLSNIFFLDIRNMLLKESGYDIIKSILYQGIGGLQDIYIQNNSNMELNNMAYLILVGENLIALTIKPLINEIEIIINKKVEFIVMDIDNQNNFLDRTKYYKL